MTLSVGYTTILQITRRISSTDNSQCLSLLLLLLCKGFFSLSIYRIPPISSRGLRELRCSSPDDPSRDTSSDAASHHQSDHPSTKTIHKRKIPMRKTNSSRKPCPRFITIMLMSWSRVSSSRLGGAGGGREGLGLATSSDAGFEPTPAAETELCCCEEGRARSTGEGGGYE